MKYWGCTISRRLRCFQCSKLTGPKEEEEEEEEEGEEEEGGGGGGAGGVGGGGGGGEAAKASLDFCWCFFIVLTPDCHFMLLVKYFNALHGMYQSIPVGNG